MVICGGYFYFKYREVPYPGDNLAYHQTAIFLFDMAAKNSSDLPDGWGGYSGYCLPIVSEKDFPLFSKKLRQELRKAAGGGFLYHSIIVGSMKVYDIDQPLLKATEGLHISGRKNVEIVIVSPSTISDETKSILEDKGLIIRII